MNRRPIGLLAIAATIVSACGGGSTSTAKPATPSQSAWQATLGHIGADGKVDTQTALQAFALAIGPLPGVTAPSGSTEHIPSGSGALRWTVGHLSELTKEQQTAVLKYVPAPSASTTALNNQHLSVAAVTAAKLPTTYPADLATDQAHFQSLVDAASSTISDHLHRPGLPATATINTRLSSDPTEASADAYTEAEDSSGGFSGPAATCHIYFNPVARTAAAGYAAMVVFHEVFHCFQASAFASLTDFYSTTTAAPWLIEGSAEWAGDSLEGSAGGTDEWWSRYLPFPNVPLFTRSYSALGFYAHMDETGVDPWSVFDAMFRAAPSGNIAAYTAGVGSSEGRFLDTWATGFLRDSSLGGEWDTTGPEISNDHYAPTTHAIGNSGTAGGSVGALANDIGKVNITAEVVNIEASDHAQLHAASGGFSSTSPSGDYCVKSGGCECPEGSEGASVPTTQLDAGMYYLAVSGGQGGGQWSVSGSSLDDFCHRDPVERCVQGRWHQTSPLWVSGTGHVFQDTGPFNAIYTFTRNSVTEDFDPSVEIHNNAGDVSLKANGSATARVRAAHGNMHFSAADFSGTSVSETIDGQTITVNATDILGAILGEGGATYECTPTTLSLHYPPATLEFAKG